MAHWLGERGQAYGAGAISFAECDASVQGWITHVRYADTWGLRQHVLDTPLRRPEKLSYVLALRTIFCSVRAAMSQYCVLVIAYDCVPGMRVSSTVLCVSVVLL
jgi:hypothetical protein